MKPTRMQLSQAIQKPQRSGQYQGVDGVPYSGIQWIVGASIIEVIHPRNVR